MHSYCLVSHSLTEPTLAVLLHDGVFEMSVSYTQVEILTWGRPPDLPPLRFPSYTAGSAPWHASYFPVPRYIGYGRHIFPTLKFSAPTLFCRVSLRFGKRSQRTRLGFGFYLMTSAGLFLGYLWCTRPRSQAWPQCALHHPRPQCSLSFFSLEYHAMPTVSRANLIRHAALGTKENHLACIGISTQNSSIQQ